MYENTTIGVVVPAYDEAPFVRDVIESVPTFVDRVYAVDDCSTDDTFAEMRRAAETWADRDDGPTVHTIRHDENRGVGGAIKTGYERALEEETGVTVVAAGDGQMDLDIVDRLVRPVVDGEADYVKGNRFLSTEDIDEMPPLRRVGNRMLEALTWVASGYWSAGDPQNGYTAISLSALEAIDVVDLYEDYGYCNELLVRLNASECRVVDVPQPATYGEEESGIVLRTYVPLVSAMLLRNFLWRLQARYLDRRVRDVPALYAAGAVCAVLAAATTLSTRRGDSGPGRSGLLAGASFLSVVGAMVLDWARNQHLTERVADTSESGAN